MINNEVRGLTDKVKNALSAAFWKVSFDDDVFAFGVFTMPDADWFMVKYNTYTHLADYLSRWVLDYKVVQIMAKWKIPEWEGQIEHELIDEINDKIYDIFPRFFEKEPIYSVDIMLDIYFQALLELKKEGLFDAKGEDFIVFLERADSAVDGLMRHRLMSLLNKKNYQECMHCLNAPHYSYLSQLI